MALTNIGKQIKGASSVQFPPANSKAVSRFQNTTGGTVTVSKLWGYFDYHATAHVKAVIYSDNAGEPDALIGTSDERIGTANGWNSLSFSTLVDIPNNDYIWIGVIADALIYSSGCSLLTGGIRYNADTYADGPTDPFGAASTTGYVYAVFVEGDDGQLRFGRSAVDGGAGNYQPDREHGEPFVLGGTRNVSVESISTYINTTSATVKSKAAIFTDSSGSPGTKIAQTEEVTGATSGAWLTLNFTSPPELSPGTYWLCFISSVNLATPTIAVSGLLMADGTDTEAIAFSSTLTLNTDLSPIGIDIYASYSYVSPTPPTGTLTITGNTPATGIPIASGELALVGGTPVPGLAIPVAPGSGSLAITGSTPVPISTASVFPATVQVRITGQSPTILVPSVAGLVVSLPPLTSLFEAKGLNASLQVTLPAITFVGETSAPGWLAVTLPPISVLLGGGNSLVVDLPMPEVLLTGAVGSIGSLHVELPSLAFSAGAGSALALDLPPLESLFTGTVGTAGSLHVSLPPFAALFAGRVENKGELVINLPGLQSLFTASQQNLGALHVDLPPLAALFSGSAGETASLQVTLPALEALFTAYEDLTGQMVIVLPALQALFEASQTGRFDTATALQLDGVILRYRRPV